MKQSQIILGSQSPRRRELIQILNLPVTTASADVDEDSVTHPDPAVNVVQTAVLKATALAQQFPNDIILTADTTVALGNQMLNKPRDTAHATKMLQQLRDNVTHEVHTGMVLWDLANGKKLEETHTGTVTMRPYTDQEIADYVASGDPLDKAGAYAIQHPTFRPVAKLEGCYLGVMGLSLCHLLEMLATLGIEVEAERTAVHDSIRRAHHNYPCPIIL